MSGTVHISHAIVSAKFRDRYAGRKWRPGAAGNVKPLFPGGSGPVSGPPQAAKNLTLVRP
jgi:hypothetical protein